MEYLNINSKKIQLLQHCAARVLTKTNNDQITPILKNLHRLPDRDRIEYKTLFLTWKGLNWYGTSYITELLSLLIPLSAV